MSIERHAKRRLICMYTILSRNFRTNNNHFDYRLLRRSQVSGMGNSLACNVNLWISYKLSFSKCLRVVHAYLNLHNCGISRVALLFNNSLWKLFCAYRSIVKSTHTMRLLCRLIFSSAEFRFLAKYIYAWECVRSMGEFFDRYHQWTNGCYFWFTKLINNIIWILLIFSLFFPKIFTI